MTSPRSPLPTSEMTPPSDSFEHDYLTAKATLARLYALPREKAIFVDGKPFTVQRELTQHMISALTKAPFGYHLYLEHGAPPDWTKDIEIRHAAGDSIMIEDGMRFYTVPPAAFGRGQ